MGCGPSSAKVQDSTQKARSPKILSARREAPNKLLGGDFGQDIIDSYNFITNNVNSIGVPSGMVSIACLNYDCFAVATAPLQIGDGTDDDLQLPVIAASVAQLGRLLCFSHVEMLSRQCFESHDTSIFIHNAFVWLTSHQSLMTPVMTLGLDPRIEADAKQQIRSLGFSVETGSFESDFSQFQLIITQSNIDFSDENCEILRQYSRNGGAIAIYYNSDPNNVENDYNANKFLYEYGLSYTYCSLSPADKVAYKINIPGGFDHVRNKNLITIKNNFKDVIDRDTVSLKYIDDIVTELRYNLMVCQNDQKPLFDEILEACWDYLKSSGYRTIKGEFCPLIEQSIIIVLMQDLFDRIPVNEIKAHPDCSVFPGISTDTEFKDAQIELTITKQSLTSTGMWLPAGVVASIEIDDEIPDDLKVQIGAHTESLVTEPRPWKRWPNVATAFPLAKGENKIVSMFGGIVLIAAQELRDRRLKLKLRFRRFLRYTRWISGKPEVFERTRDFGAPWGEVVTQKCILTMPKSNISRVEDFERLDRWILRLVNKPTELMGYHVKRPFRIVFDVQTANNRPVQGYPLVFPLSMIEGIVHNVDRKSPAVFWFLQAIALNSIREGCFDGPTEAALASCVACFVYADLFGEIDPFAPELLTRDASVLFKTLWAIHTDVNSRLIKQILSKSEEPDAATFDTDDDQWTSFVRDLCNLGEMNFSEQLAPSHPIPLNIMAEVEGLPKCPSLNI